MGKTRRRGTLAEISPATALIRWALNAAKCLSPMHWLKRCLPLLKPRGDVTSAEVASPDYVKRRARAIELYMLTWIAVEGVLVWLMLAGPWPSLWVRCGICITASVRIVEIVQVTVNATLFDSLGSSSIGMHVALHARMVVLAAINFIELLVCFGIFFGTEPALIEGGSGPATGLYLSVMNQLTIGYGDVSPMGWLRVVAVTQGLIGALFIVLVFGRFVASMPALRSVFPLRTQKSAGWPYNSRTPRDVTFRRKRRRGAP